MRKQGEAGGTEPESEDEADSLAGGDWAGVWRRGSDRRQKRHKTTRARANEARRGRNTTQQRQSVSQPVPANRDLVVWCKQAHGGGGGLILPQTRSRARAKQ